MQEVQTHARDTACCYALHLLTRTGGQAALTSWRRSCTDESVITCACGFFSRRADTESKPAARDRFARMPVAPSPCLYIMTYRANSCSSPHSTMPCDDACSWHLHCGRITGWWQPCERNAALWLDREVTELLGEHTLRQLLQLHSLRQRGQPQSPSFDTCMHAQLLGQPEAISAACSANAHAGHDHHCMHACMHAGPTA
jgi:hypothetical protein